MATINVKNRAKPGCSFDAQDKKMLDSWLAGELTGLDMYSNKGRMEIFNEIRLNKLNYTFKDVIDYLLGPRAKFAVDSGVFVGTVMAEYDHKQLLKVMYVLFMKNYKSPKFMELWEGDIYGWAMIALTMGEKVKEAEF